MQKQYKLKISHIIGHSLGSDHTFLCRNQTLTHIFRQCLNLLRGNRRVKHKSATLLLFLSKDKTQKNRGDFIVVKFLGKYCLVNSVNACHRNGVDKVKSALLNSRKLSQNCLILYACDFKEKNHKKFFIYDYMCQVLSVILFAKLKNNFLVFTKKSHKHF